MKKVLFSVLLITLSINLYSNDKIVGGEEVKNFDEASYLVTYGGCAGSIISDKWILTAAHCKSLFQRDMYAGSLVLDDNTLKLEKARS